MTRRKPRAIRPGARLAVLSPASTPKVELIAAGVARLQELGYEVKVFPHAADKGPLYYAGRVEDRVADLHAAFADEAIDGIVCTRGGWGSAELLPYLDAALIREHAKVFVGYSDQSSLHTWLWNEVGLVSFHGPMVAADLSRPDGLERFSWNAALEGASSWNIDSQQGLRTLRPGMADGILHGGCLSILAEGLGTPYGMRTEDAVRCRILFLEDIGPKPYQWDRMLLHLRYAGMLEHVSGIVFGDMAQCVGPEEEELLEGAILHALRGFHGPIGIGLRSGHVARGNVTLPLGVGVRLDLRDEGNPRMDFLEAAVEG